MTTRVAVNAYLQSALDKTTGEFVEAMVSRPKVMQSIDSSWDFEAAAC